MNSAFLFSYFELNSYAEQVKIAANKDFSKKLMDRVGAYITAAKEGNLSQEQVAFLIYILDRISKTGKHETWTRETLFNGHTLNYRNISVFARQAASELRTQSAELQERVDTVRACLSKSERVSAQEREIFHDHDFLTFSLMRSLNKSYSKKSESLLNDESFDNLPIEMKIDILAHYFHSSVKIDRLMDKILKLNDQEFKLLLQKVRLSDDHKEKFENWLCIEIGNDNYSRVHLILQKCKKYNFAISNVVLKKAADKGEKYVRLFLNIIGYPDSEGIKILQKKGYAFVAHYAPHPVETKPDFSIRFMDGTTLSLNKNTIKEMFKDSNYLLCVKPLDWSEFKTVKEIGTEEISIEDLPISPREEEGIEDKTATLKEICPELVKHLTPDILRILASFYEGNRGEITAINAQFSAFQAVIGYLNLQSFVSDQDAFGL